MLEQLKQSVLETALRMVRDGIAHGAQGNISARDPETGLVAITPSAIHYEDMCVDDVPIIDIEGKVIEGQWKPTSETPMHTLFYRYLPDLGAVVHSHAPYASAFAITGQPIPVVLIESAACIGHPVQVAPYATPGTEELGRICLDTMGDGCAVILANHGLLSIGHTLDQAYDATIAAETTARLVILARSMSAEPIPMPSEAAEKMRQSYLKHYKPAATN
jgi:ribulose-5-phosphate 4-epimerase/fuculose-1-phosphate aldolase